MIPFIKAHTNIHLYKYDCKCPHMNVIFELQIPLSHEDEIKMVFLFTFKRQTFTSPMYHVCICDVTQNE